MPRTPKDDANELLNSALPFAFQMLREHGEFYPYGRVMRPDGSIEMFGADDGVEHPSSKKLIELLEGAFRHFALEGRYKATAIVYDVRTIPPGATEKTDAVAVRLDHEDNYSVVVMIPYRRAPDGEVSTGALFAANGAGSIFPAK
jgi:hypothetical protein